MKTFSTFVTKLRVGAVTCASTSLLLASCGGDHTGLPDGAQAVPEVSAPAVAAPIDAAALAMELGDGGPPSTAATAVPADEFAASSGFKDIQSAGTSSADRKVSTPVPDADTGDLDAGGDVELADSSTTRSIWVSAQNGKDLDNNEGSRARPFATIGKAVTYARPGTVVHVASGIYRENVRTRNSGTASARVRYVSATKWGAKIIGSGTESMWTNSGDYTDIVGFDITGSGRLGILNLGSHTLMARNYVHNLTVSGGCTGSGGAGIVNANYKGSDGDIIGNVVHDIGVPGTCNGVQGIYHSNLGGRIYNNIVYRASSFGIHLWHAANNVTIANNTVFANGAGGMGGGIVMGTGDAPGGIVLDNTKVINNIVYGNPSASIVQYCYSGQNCIGPNNIVANNLVYANGRPIRMRVGSATNTVLADPQFVNYEADGTGDYRLKGTSPAIDKGTATSAPTTDIGDAPRPQDGAPDIGAYEYGTTAPIPAPVPTPTPTPEPTPPPAPTANAYPSPNAHATTDTDTTTDTATIA